MGRVGGGGTQIEKAFSGVENTGVASGYGNQLTPFLYYWRVPELCVCVCVCVCVYTFTCARTYTCVYVHTETDRHRHTRKPRWAPQTHTHTHTYTHTPRWAPVASVPAAVKTVFLIL
jgi:hypothetical protein